MLELSYKTKGNAQPKGKPRVFFTCHPVDIERSLDRLCSDIFLTQDCAVYYAQDMTEAISDEDYTVQLEQMNLFVVPVSLKLLIEPNRAMDQDVPFAMDKHIPILPIMLEPGLDAVYSREDKFGKLQYLDPNARDLTAIPYEEKLKKHLSSVLIDDETAERVRKAFDAYIFLSYRKKDRKYANELMRLIHAYPQCRDIAIWYDEYLTPGESFSDAIQAALEKSELFTLLVTPNLVNEENYIQTTEYPVARESGKDILPVEMEATDRTELETHFQEVPTCTNPEDEQFQARLLDSLRHIALRENDADPTHNYLIGLAYLDGIDVEIDKARGLELITAAAEADLPEAMKKLRGMYTEGSGVQLDYCEAIKWAKRLAYYYAREYGEEHPETLRSLHNLAFCCSNIGESRELIELSEKVYALRRRLLGEEHIDTLYSLNNLASGYANQGEYHKAFELMEKVCMQRANTLGDNHPDTLYSQHNLAVIYAKTGQYRKAIELGENIYAQQCLILGEEHPDTLSTLHILSGSYLRSGVLHEALEGYEKCYAQKCHTFGENHPETLATLNDLALIYSTKQDCCKAFDLLSNVYNQQCQILGENHPQTLRTLNNLGKTYGKLGNHKKEIELMEKAYALRCRFLGEEHPDTVVSMQNLAVTYEEQGNTNKAKELSAKLDSLCARDEPQNEELKGIGNSLSVAQQIRQVVKRLRTGRKPQLANEVPRKILQTAIYSYATGVKIYDIIAIDDGGFFSRGKKGVLYTTEALYSSELTPDSFIAYSEIASVFLYEDGLRFHMKNGITQMVDFGSYQEQVYQIISALFED